MSDEIMNSFSRAYRGMYISNNLYKFTTNGALNFQ